MQAIKETKCPHCGYLMDSSENMTGTRDIEPGDFSICLNCGHPLVYTRAMGLRSASEVDLKIFEKVSPKNYSEFRRLQSLIFDRGPIR